MESTRGGYCAVDRIHLGAQIINQPRLSLIPPWSSAPLKKSIDKSLLVT